SMGHANPRLGGGRAPAVRRGPYSGAPSAPPRPGRTRALGGAGGRGAQLLEVLLPELLREEPDGRLLSGPGVRVASPEVARRGAHVVAPPDLVARQVDLGQEDVPHPLGFDGVQVPEGLLERRHGAARVAPFGQGLPALVVPCS